MTTEFKHIPDCITASTLTPFITESFKYEDNTELSTVFDWLYNCIKSKPNMSVEAAISLMDAFNRGIRIALRTGIDEEPDFSKTNIYSVGKYYKYFVDKVEDAFRGKQDAGVIYEIDRFNFDDPSEKDEYIKSVRMDYRVKILDTCKLINMVLEYPIYDPYDRFTLYRMMIEYPN